MAPETYSSSSSSRLCFFLQRTETLLKQTKINWEIHWACFRHPRIHSPFPQKSRPSHEYQLSPSLPPGIGYTDHKVAQVGWSRHKQKLKSQLLTLSREWEINLGGGDVGKNLSGAGTVLSTLLPRSHQQDPFLSHFADEKPSVREALKS